MRRFRAAYVELQKVRGLTREEVMAILDLWRAEMSSAQAPSVKSLDSLRRFEQNACGNAAGCVWTHLEEIR
jgi:hypothetical protein